MNPKTRQILNDWQEEAVYCDQTAFPQDESVWDYITYDEYAPATPKEWYHASSCGIEAGTFLEPREVERYSAGNIGARPTGLFVTDLDALKDSWLSLLCEQYYKPTDTVHIYKVRVYDDPEECRINEDLRQWITYKGVTILEEVEAYNVGAICCMGVWQVIDARKYGANTWGIIWEKELASMRGVWPPYDGKPCPMYAYGSATYATEEEATHSFKSSPCYNGQRGALVRVQYDGLVHVMTQFVREIVGEGSWD